ncbi:DUF2306 domain-containing protein [Luteibaculum oceani]|uniref:DUF2306 domain-containing protein n=1 Tax=Luteibaculum oceani TaxID=1294296 RepID=A0A5C6VAC5_9FLAO|nr:hypothetical protein [Luteibaculum oceani]TXC81764.1 hypothetical protein FRX97_04405 [Luteibaculum oceani]
MEWIIKGITWTHVLAGFSSLIVFWIPVFTKKGGEAHRKAGKIYVALMWAVVISAFLLCINNLSIARYSSAAFLGFLSLITGNVLWYGIAILKNKKGLSSQFRRIQLLLQGAIVLASSLLIFYGIWLEGHSTAILMFVFGGLGLTDLPKFIKNLKGSKSDSWLKTHIVGMCTSGIAAYTAFFVFGGRVLFKGLFVGYWSVVPWIAPGIVGGMIIYLMVRRFDKKKPIT